MVRACVEGAQIRQTHALTSRRLLGHLFSVCCDPFPVAAVECRHEDICVQTPKDKFDADVEEVIGVDEEEDEVEPRADGREGAVLDGMRDEAIDHVFGLSIGGGSFVAHQHDNHGTGHQDVASEGASEPHDDRSVEGLEKVDFQPELNELHGHCYCGSELHGCEQQYKKCCHTGEGVCAKTIDSPSKEYLRAERHEAVQCWKSRTRPRGAGQGIEVSKSLCKYSV